MNKNVFHRSKRIGREPPLPPLWRSPPQGEGFAPSPFRNTKTRIQIAIAMTLTGLGLLSALGAFAAEGGGAAVDVMTVNACDRRGP